MAAHSHYVLVGVDGTEESERAVRFAAGEARRQRLPLRLVHVPNETQALIPMAPVIPIHDDEGVVRVGMQVLEDAVRIAQDHVGDDVEVQGVLERGGRVHAILKAAERADVIVLGTRGSRLRRILTGSTTTGVAARAKCPVVCVPPVWDESVEHLRVLAGIDGSAATPAVLEEAFAQAEARTASLTILHAWQPQPAYADVAEVEGASRTWQHETEHRLSELTARIRADHPGLHVVNSVHYAPTASDLADASYSADLLVLGRRGHGAPLGLSLGSIARSLIAHAACPVLIVPLNEPD